MFITDGMWASKYPPGHSLLLAIGVLLGDARIVPIFLAGALVACTYVFMRNAFGTRQAVLGAVLLSLSPLVWAQYGSLMSFGTSACAFAAFLAALSQAARTGRASYGLFAGLALGWLAITRPLEAASLGMPALAMLAGQAVRGLTAARVRFAAVVSGCAAVVWILLLHNYVITGSPFQLAYQLDPERFSFGFRRVFQHHDYVHTPHAAVANLLTAAARIDLWMLAWPGSSLLVLAGLIRARRTSFDRLLAMMLGSFVLCMSFIYSSGTWDFGPTYYFVCVPLLIPIAIRGLHWLWSEAKAACAPTLARAIGWTPIVGLALCLLTVGPLRLVSIAMLAKEVRAPWELIARQTKGNVLVALPPPFTSAVGWAFGYPYTIENGRETTAKLFYATSAQERADAVRFLGAELPQYELTRDERQFADTGRRVYSLRLLDGRERVGPKP
jgi:4-amino-4-deoxy-L-arabinose transferase-like glycosyltransferase